MSWDASENGLRQPALPESHSGHDWRSEAQGGVTPSARASQRLGVGSSDRLIELKSLQDFWRQVQL